MKIAVATATRAEYGILHPLIKKMVLDSDIDLQLLVTGTHLSKEYGNTQNEIIKDGIPIYKRFKILSKGNSPQDVSLTVANAINGFADYFIKEDPDCIIVLGDRTEILGICSAAVITGIPIVHLHGGELTEGAIDDCIRHAITKMAYLHFPCTDIYRKRIIQMGESPDRVYNVGALGVENILNVSLFSQNEIYQIFDIPNYMKYVVVTFHPVTLQKGEEYNQISQLIEAMECQNEYYYLITKANADSGSEIINTLLKKFTQQFPNTKLVSSLGMKKYLSSIKYASFVLGNSSSGIIEGIPYFSPALT